MYLALLFTGGFLISTRAKEDSADPFFAVRFFTQGFEQVT